MTSPSRPATPPAPAGAPPAGPAPAPSRPVPVPDDLSAPYWEAAARHELALARCGRCRAFAVPPGMTCPHCHHTEPGFAFEPVPGGGTVRSWTVVRQSFLPGFAAEVPFLLVDVELDVQADLRMIGRLLDGPDAALRAGDRVAVAFEDVAPGVAVPAFVLATGAGGQDGARS